ncbi:putative WD repeat-containing protein C2A9.03 [Beauveria bassiana]|nr:putative WD repeat-containing protein C2A9.03 [Beauveria bassiana]
MRTSSSHTTRVPPNDPQQDNGQLSRRRSRLLSRQTHDSDSDSDNSTSDPVSWCQPARSHLPSHLVDASSPANSAVRMSSSAVEGPNAPSASHHSQSTLPPSQSRNDGQSDMDIPDNDGQDSDPELDSGGAALALMAPPQMPVQPITFGMPAGPTDLANLPPLHQPPPNWVPLPAFLADQNLTISDAIPAILGSENLDLVDFLRDWAYQGRYGRAGRSQPPLLDELMRQTQEQPDEISFAQLEGDQYDLQGFNWAAMKTTRKAARLRRQHTYRNYVNRMGSDRWMASIPAFPLRLDSNQFCLQTPHQPLSSRESFYRFNRMHIRRDVCLAHFQLRSVLACPTRTHAYYPTPQGIARMNLASGKSETFMNTRDFPAAGAVISTVDADCGVLMCGTFNGEYCIKRLDAPEKHAYTEGQITSDPGGITNHIKIHKPRRSCGPAAAIASNDHGFRLLDLETQTIVQEKRYPFALNCTAVSPDRRLRTVVGDHFNVLITNADTGEVLQELGGHRDYGFACDWSDDGWTVATGFQDMAVKIWDARRWCNTSGQSTPLCTIRTEMAGARSLRFSPLGSGPPVLVAAEEADFVNIIDAKMFHYRQEIDVFGEIGGIAFANDGQDLNVLCCDSQRGGLLQLQRCRGRRNFMRSYDEDSMANRHSWLPDTDITPAMDKIPTFF